MAKDVSDLIIEAMERTGMDNLYVLYGHGHPKFGQLTDPEPGCSSHGFDCYYQGPHDELLAYIKAFQGKKLDSDPMFKAIYQAVDDALAKLTDKEISFHWNAGRRWFEWRQAKPKTREDQISDIKGIDPIAVEGGAFDFWTHRKIIPKRIIFDWRNGED